MASVSDPLWRSPLAICKRARTNLDRYIRMAPLPPFGFLFLLFSSALFAFWLRSSVVSVLFSLISETALRSRIVINLIFVTRRSSLWACPWSTATVSLVLHCLQATRKFLFHCTLGLCSGCEEEENWILTRGLARSRIGCSASFTLASSLPCAILVLHTF